MPSWQASSLVLGEDLMPEFPFHGKISDKILYLLQYAALAPSAFNTQPWKFQIKHDSVIVYADTSCWMKIADPEKRQLFISLGCAVENLMVAARHFGLESTCLWQEDTYSFEV